MNEIDPTLAMLSVALPTFLALAMTGLMLVIFQPFLKGPRIWLLPAMVCVPCLVATTSLEAVTVGWIQIFAFIMKWLVAAILFISFAAACWDSYAQAANGKRQRKVEQ